MIVTEVGWLAESEEASDEPHPRTAQHGLNPTRVAESGERKDGHSGLFEEINLGRCRTGARISSTAEIAHPTLRPMGQQGRGGSTASERSEHFTYS